MFFVACGISRLARYNVTAPKEGKVTHYDGAPIPTSLAIVGVLLIAYVNGATGVDGIWGGHYRLGFTGHDYGFHPFSLLYFLCGCLFASNTVRFPKIG